MTADVESGGVLQFFVGIVENVKAVDGVVLNHREIRPQWFFSTGRIVISFYKKDLRRATLEPRQELGQNLLSASNLGVKNGLPQ